MLGFQIGQKNGEYRVGDRLSFYPCVDIYQYKVADNNERFLKHVIYDLYEFTFKAIDKYEHYEEGEDVELWKSRYHYLIEIIPGFKVFHFNWPLKADEYLQLNTLYRGSGNLSNCGNPALQNRNIDTEAIKNIHCKGILEKIQINGLWRDCHDYTEGTVDDENDCILISYDDILKSIGYPDDMVKFQSIIAKYEDNCTCFKSTSDCKDTDKLVYAIKMA